MRTVAERLTWARKRSGYESAAEAARALGMAEPTVRAHENGTREPGKPNLRKYSRAFRVPYSWLANGEGAPDSRRLPVLGYVGAGAEVFPDDGAARAFDPMDLPPGATSDCFALIVRGESRYPRYDDGDVIICMPEVSEVSNLVGMDCVLDVEDGRRLLKRLERGSKRGLFTLNSENASPIRDVKVLRAAPVRWVIRAWSVGL